MKRQKATKLALINLLSDPHIEIWDWRIENEIQKIDVTTWDDPHAEPLRRQTGRSSINITIFKHEPDTATTKHSGAAKGEKGSNSEPIKPPPQRFG